MTFSRRGRLEETKQQKRLLIALVGSVSLVVFLLAFGFKILIGFSLLVDTIRGTTPQTPQTTKKRIFPPVLDPIPIATRSGALRISGTGEQNLTITIYVDNGEAKKTVVAGNGNFFTTIAIRDGEHTIQANLSDNKGNTSDLSEGLKITVKSANPILEINTPDENATITGDSNIVKVEGKTEDETNVTINGRFVVIRNDNSFSYDYPLSDGDNTLSIEAKDQAGNTTKVERKVTYHK
jgi:bacillopeptidase F